MNIRYNINIGAYNRYLGKSILIYSVDNYKIERIVLKYKGKITGYVWTCFYKKVKMNISVSGRNEIGLKNKLWELMKEESLLSRIGDMDGNKRKVNQKGGGNYEFKRNY